MVKERDWFSSYSSCLICGYVEEDIDPMTLMDIEDTEYTNDGNRRQRGRAPSHRKVKL